MFNNIVILTGAGISADSGLATFRGADGLWCGHRIEDVATPEAFSRNPALVHTFYNKRRTQLSQVEPNVAHHALATLAAEWRGKCLLVTQNVDDLHDRALSSVMPAAGFSFLHMHGELMRARCLDTGRSIPWGVDIEPDTPSPLTGRHGALRPDIVWFGEMPMGMEAIHSTIEECDLFVSIGTSGKVYPAAGFVALARHAGAHTMEINLEPSEGMSFFAERLYGRAVDKVPAYVASLLQKQQLR